jgi:hypothetical protein
VGTEYNHPVLKFFKSIQQLNNFHFFKISNIDSLPRKIENH